VPRLSVSKEGLSNAGLKLAGILAGIAFFFIVAIGGGVYRTDCVTSSGQVITTWGAEGDIPYLWSPDDSRCRAYTLMRYVLGSVGVMSAVKSLDKAYTPELVRQVGAGSVAMAQLIPAFESLKTVGGFSDPSSQQAMLYLFQGQLKKLSANDLATLSQENQTAATHIGPVLTKLNALAASISGAVVNPATYPSLPADSKTFVAEWNAELTSTATALRNVSQALSGMHPFYGEFEQLIQAVYHTAQLRSTVQFDKLRSSVFKDMAPRYQRVQSAQQSLTAAQPIEHKLMSFVNGSQDAQAVVTRVNHGYPNGFLAQEFKRS
jgi:hypothetical protein